MDEYLEQVSRWSGIYFMGANGKRAESTDLKKG